MKFTILAGLSVLALSAIASSPASALTERFDQSHQAILNKGISSEVNLSERFQDARDGRINKLNERFQDARDGRINK
ncbi:MAG: hypothetical protein HC769_36580 [Cyanobacteria bacterium CRU_2_1]|nr:hypothetical protein [Cyanobacteria bacterium CRU_2_1]